MNKRIVIVYDTIYPYQKGGGEKRLYEIAHALRKHGWEISWYCLNWWGGSPTIIIDGIEYHGVCSEQLLRNKNGSRRTLKGALRFCYYLSRYSIPKDTYAILIGQTPWIHFFVMMFKAFGKSIPIVIDCWEIWRAHWISYYGPLIGRLGMIIEYCAVIKAHHLMAISDMTSNMILKLGIDINKITLAPNGVNLKEISAAPCSKNHSDLIYFGRLVAHKNVDILIHSTKILVKKYPNLKVNILGDGPELSRLRQLVELYGLQYNVNFLGFIDRHRDAMSLLKASKIFVLPSTSEGGGSIALMEAHACGLPVVAVMHPQGIDPKLVKHNVTGIWIDELSPMLMADAILKLMSDDFRKSISLNCLEVSKNYDWNSVGEIYDAMLNSLKSNHQQ